MRSWGSGGIPCTRRSSRWQKAIPQYALGHLGSHGRTRGARDAHAGALFLRKLQGGDRVGDCLIAGESLARRIAGAHGAVPPGTSGEGSFTSVKVQS